MKSINWAKYYHFTVIFVIFALIALPIITTFIYALSTRWGATILPEELTLHWVIELWQDPRFLMALGRSLFVTTSAIILSLLLILPVIFFITYYYPAGQKVMNILILMPLTIPAIVSSIGLIQIFSEPPFLLTGTPWILIGCYFTIALPFLYRAIMNNIQSVDIKTLVDCGTLFGVSKLSIFCRVIIPSLRTGILSGALISCSFLLGEFVFANLLVGNRFETLQVYLFNMSVKSGHFTSALVASFFLFMMALSLILLNLNKTRKPL